MWQINALTFIGLSAGLVIGFLTGTTVSFRAVLETLDRLDAEIRRHIQSIQNAQDLIHDLRADRSNLRRRISRLEHLNKERNLATERRKKN